MCLDCWKCYILFAVYILNIFSVKHNNSYQQTLISLAFWKSISKKSCNESDGLASIISEQWPKTAGGILSLLLLFVNSTMLFDVLLWNIRIFQSWCYGGDWPRLGQQEIRFVTNTVASLYPFFASIAFMRPAYDQWNKNNGLKNLNHRLVWINV